VASLLAYTAATFWQARREGESVRAEFSEGVTGGGHRIAVDLLLIIAGLAGLTAGGGLLVSSAVALATAFGVSQAVIGLTIVAIGTSLPELVTSLVATARGQSDLAIGNLLGSNIFNILGILGVAALIQPLPRGDIAWMDLAIMILLGVVLVRMARTGLTVSRAEGAILLVSYIGYMAWRIAE